MVNKYRNTYETTKLLFYFNYNEVMYGGNCENGHFCSIPEDFEIEDGNKLHCYECGTLIARVTKIKVTEEEI